MKKTIFKSTILLLFSTTFSAQTFVNKVYQDSYGTPVFNPILNPLGIQWSKTITGSGGKIITVGNTAVSGEGENIFLRKTDADGNIIFQVNRNTSGTNNDYGIGVYEAASGDIYVCGTTDNGGTTNYDAVILRYNSSGTLLNNTTWAGTAGKNDIATALIKHPVSGNIILAITNENNSTGYDYRVLSVNPTNLTTVATNTYDSGSSLADFALGVEVDPSNNNIKIIGGSQSSAFTSAYAVAIFNSSLTYLSAVRTDLSATPADQPIAYKQVGNDVYVTGKTFNGSNYDIKTIKINSSYNIAWNVTLDVSGYDDVANTIDVDPTNGNVIIGGLYTKSGNTTNMISVRYNGSTGAVIGTPFKQAAQNPAGNAVIKKLVTSTTGDVYYVAGEKNNAGKMQVIVGKLNSSGIGGWQKNVSNPSQDVLPSDIEVNSGGIFAISVLDSTVDRYIETKYSELTLDTTKKYIGGKACWKKGELLVTFAPTVVNKAAVNNQVGSAVREFGNLSDYITSGANSAISTALCGVGIACPIQVVKVYDMKTTDTTAVTRQGETVSIPQFWSTFLLKLPSSIDERRAKNVLNTMPSIVHATQLNNFIEVTSVPNDSLYANAANLHPVGLTTNAHINVEDAWNVVTNCGTSSVKGGVFDTGIMYRHKDFNYTGSDTTGRAKLEGWYFGNGFGSSNALNYGVDMRTQSYGLSDFTLDWLDHGTKVAGIIGAQRNNTSGVAGIAGGDGTTSNPGVKLYSLNVAAGPMLWLLKAYYEAHTGNNNNSLPFAYGVNFSNHSYKMVPGWWPADSFSVAQAQVHYANRLGVTFIASRGNDSTNNYVFPANCDPNWAISVGASNASGTKWSGSSYGSDMDVIAPGVSQIVQSTSGSRGYGNFSGTSSAAPHASGVVGLLMSYMNTPQTPYMNLAPEDCDFILQRSATDVGPTGYDSINGYGRLNAGKALRMVEKPFRILYHFGTNYRYSHTKTTSVYANWDTVRLTEAYTNYASPRVSYPVGKYLVKAYQVTATVNHAGLYPSDSIMYFWPRHSASNVYGLPVGAKKKLDMHERVIITSLGGGSANLKGYVYQVKDSTGTNSLGWWPCDTSFTSGNLKSLFEYSVLSKNKAVGIHENSKNVLKVNLFPNPANQSQTIEIDSDKDCPLKIELYDIMGRYIKIVYEGNASFGKNSIVNSIVGLPNSMYIYIIKLDGKTTSRKFIKE